MINWIFSKIKPPPQDHGGIETAELRAIFLVAELLRRCDRTHGLCQVLRDRQTAQQGHSQ